jgi:hypothetical protein
VNTGITSILGIYVRSVSLNNLSEPSLPMCGFGAGPRVVVSRLPVLPEGCNYEAPLPNHEPHKISHFSISGCFFLDKLPGAVPSTPPESDPSHFITPFFRCTILILVAINTTAVIDSGLSLARPPPPRHGRGSSSSFYGLNCGRSSIYWI